MLLSATVPPDVEQIARRYQARQLRLDLCDGARACPGYDLAAVEIVSRDRNAALVNLLRFHNPRAAVIFCNRRSLVAVVAAQLAGQGFRVVMLSGALPQQERQCAIQAMRSGAARICVATDLAARGLDLPGLDLVLHAEVPSGSRALLHRSGRSGRTDKRGRSVILATRRERDRVETLASAARLALEWEIVPAPDEVRRRDREIIAADPCFHDPPDGETRALAERIVARHGSENLAVAAAQLWRSLRPDPVALEGRRSGGRGEVWIEVAADGDDPARMGDVVRRVAELAGVPRAAIGRVHVGQEHVRFEVTGADGKRLREEGRGSDRKAALLRLIDAPRRGAGRPQ